MKKERPCDKWSSAPEGAKYFPTEMLCARRRFVRRAYLSEKY